MYGLVRRLLARMSKSGKDLKEPELVLVQTKEGTSYFGLSDLNYSRTEGEVVLQEVCRIQTEDLELLVTESITILEEYYGKEKGYKEQGLKNDRILGCVLLRDENRPKKFDYLDEVSIEKNQIRSVSELPIPSSGPYQDVRQKMIEFKGIFV